MTAVWEEKLEAIDTAEVHWSTSTILAVFFAASLISAVFFGLGYSFGLGGTAKPAFSIANTRATAAADESVSKPPTERHAVQGASPRETSNSIISRSDGSASPVHAAFRQVSASERAHVIPAKAARPAPAETHGKAAALDAGAAHYMVQVGAIGDHKDARRLVAQLRKSGFHAGIYPGKHDKYLHVQIGPFATTEQANTMRHRVAANGYRAILKRAS